MVAEVVVAMDVAKKGTQRYWSWWWPGGVELLAMVAAEVAAGEGGGSHDGCGGHGGHGGSRMDPAVPGTISPWPRGLVLLHWVGSPCAESEGHWG